MKTFELPEIDVSRIKMEEITGDIVESQEDAGDL